MGISVSVGVLSYLPFHLIVSPFLSHCIAICISPCPCISFCISLCPCISFCPVPFPTVYLFTSSSTHVYISMSLHIFLSNAVPNSIPVHPFVYPCVYLYALSYLSVQCCSQQYTCSPVRLPFAHHVQLHPTQTEWKIRLERANEQFYFEVGWII